MMGFFAPDYFPVTVCSFACETLIVRLQTGTKPPEKHSKDGPKKRDLWRDEFKRAGSPTHAHTQFRPPLVWSCLNSGGWFTSGGPQNKTLLRKQQRQQHACWRRRRAGRKSPSQQAGSLRPGGSRSDLCCSAVPVSSRCGAFFLLSLSSSYVPSLPPPCFSLCIPCLVKSGRSQ